MTTSHLVARVDPAVAHEVAAAYLDASDRRDSLTTASFDQLVQESDELYRWITSPARRRRLRVSFTSCQAPYRDAEELIASVRESRAIEITTVAADPNRRHPVIGNERGGAYDRFRAVHDVVGHVRMQLGFDRDEEYSAWLAQERFHTPLARWALATELHGHHSVRWTTGDIAEPKAFLFDPVLLHRTHPKEMQL